MTMIQNDHHGMTIVCSSIHQHGKDYGHSMIEHVKNFGKIPCHRAAFTTSMEQIVRPLPFDAAVDKNDRFVSQNAKSNQTL